MSKDYDNSYSVVFVSRQDGLSGRSNSSCSNLSYREALEQFQLYQNNIHPDIFKTAWVKLFDEQGFQVLTYGPLG